MAPEELRNKFTTKKSLYEALTVDCNVANS